MLRLRFTIGSFPPCDGVFQVRFLTARVYEQGIELLLALEPPHQGVYAYWVKDYTQDSLNGQAVYGGGELESILRAFLGDSAPVESDAVIHLIDSGALAGRVAEVVVVDGKPLMWNAVSQAVPAGTA